MDVVIAPVGVDESEKALEDGAESFHGWTFGERDPSNVFRDRREIMRAAH